MARNTNTSAPSPGQLLDEQGVLRISRLKIAKSKLKIGTWNVRSLYAAGKFDNLIQEARRMETTIMGISELRWPGSGTCRHDEGILYYSGSEDNDTQHRNGVGILIKPELEKYVKQVIPINNRIIILQLNASLFNVNIIQIYAPTAEKKYDHETEILYQQLDDVLNHLKKDEINFIMGDFNAKIGKGRRSDLVGEYGLGESNERGDRLYEFAQEHDMVVTNTWYRLPKRRLYTWTAPGDNTEHIIRNQIDYILVAKRFRNCVTRVTTYPGADIGSDHNPLVANIKINLKKLNKNNKSLKFSIGDVDINKLRNELNDSLDTMTGISGNTVNETWEIFREHIIKTMEENTTNNIKPKKKRWMTEEILKLMEERRKCKNNTEEYKSKQREIKNKIKNAKEEWMTDRCEEMEDLERRHDTFNMYKKVREVAGLFNKKAPSILMDNAGKTIIDEGEVLNAWIQYIDDLFGDNRPASMTDVEDNEGPEILKSEVLFNIKSAKTKKAAGPDDIPVELLQLINEKNIDILVKLFNDVYNTGEIPEEWLRSVFITIPKKQRARRCNDHRLISLMSHTLKVFLKIIHSRIRNKCENDLDETQFGFRNALGTREAMFALNVLLQKCRDQRKDVFVCFIDYEKAFDRVQHEKLINILRGAGVDGKDLRIIKNLYWQQKAVVRVNGRFTDERQIQRGVRQGCVLSPLLFNLYSDKVFKEALHDKEFGVKINGELINTIRYADDTAILCDDLQGLQNLINSVNAVGQEMGLNINVAKTKFMVFSRQPYLNASLEVNGQNIERVSSFKYLGCYITEQLDPEKEVRCRIESARATFKKMRSLFCNDSLNLKLRQRMIKCYIWSVLLYGAEVWTLKAATINRLEAFEMWLHRRMLKIPWVALQRNEAVLDRANTVRELLTTVKCRKLAYLGHVLRGNRYRILQLIMKGKIEGRRGVGRKQISWLKNIRDWTGIHSVEQLFRMAEDRDQLAIVIANVRGT